MSTNLFPLHLLKASEKSYMLVEVKGGNTYNGTLSSCDRFMNLKLIDSVLTTKDGSKFYKIPEIYIKGSTLKYIQMQDNILDKALDDSSKYKNTIASASKIGKFKTNRGGFRGGDRGHTRDSSRGRGGSSRGRN